jgi:hypothetical protein
VTHISSFNAAENVLVNDKNFDHIFDIGCFDVIPIECECISEKIRRILEIKECYFQNALLLKNDQ